MWMLKTTKSSTLKAFLKTEFVRVGDKKADEVLKKTNIQPTKKPQSLNRDEIAELIDAFKSTDFLPPPTDCLSPIGDKNIMRSLINKYKVEWAYAVTRKPKVFSGNPFLVEVGIGYGGELRGDEKVRVIRFANKIPLLYSQGGCALTKAVENVNWKSYGLSQSKNELPTAPAVFLIHVASTNIPYTSESKEAVTVIPEIYEEIRLALQEVGRKLKEYIDRKERYKKKKSKEDVLNKILPLLAKKVAEVLERDEIDVSKVISRIIGNIHIQRDVTEKDGVIEAELKVSNYTRAKKEFKIYEIIAGSVEADDNEVKITESGGHSTMLWNIKLNANETRSLKYTVKGRIINKKPYVDGVDESLIDGAELMSF
jgi:DNA topoisomerase-6 subunit B